MHQILLLQLWLNQRLFCVNGIYITGSEERTPEPKPRWNPKPEQIRILESIFNSGMVNPPRDEIRRIRSQLQIYGQVGDANVFYWFQNRKSRSKHKQRHLKSTAAAAKSTAPPPPPLTSVTSSSTSSSSSSGSNNKQISAIPTLSSFFDQNNLFQAPILMPELSLESSVLLPTSQPSYQLSSGELAGGSPAVWGDIILQEIMPGKDIGSVSTDSASLACVVSANMTTAMATATASTVNEIQGTLDILLLTYLEFLLLSFFVSVLFLCFFGVLSISCFISCHFIAIWRSYLACSILFFIILLFL